MYGGKRKRSHHNILIKRARTKRNETQKRESFELRTSSIWQNTTRPLIEKIRNQMLQTKLSFMISPNPILSGRCEVRSHATICTCLEQHAFLHRKLTKIVTKSKNSGSITLTPHKLTHHKRESPEPRKRFCDTATLLSNGRRVLRRAQKVARQK